MANYAGVQIVQEGPRNAVIKVTGELGANLALTTLLDITTLNQGGTGPTPTSVRVDYVWFAIQDGLDVLLDWHATSNTPLMPLAGRGRERFDHFGGLQNNAGAGKNGNIDITVNGWTVGTMVFTIVLELVKQGPDL